MIEAKLFEEGNGFPSVGDYVQDCENLYKVESLVNCIHTSRPGVGNYMYCTIFPANWEDTDNIFPVKVEK